MTGNTYPVCGVISSPSSYANVFLMQDSRRPQDPAMLRLKQTMVLSDLPASLFETAMGVACHRVCLKLNACQCLSSSSSETKVMSVLVTSCQTGEGTCRAEAQNNTEYTNTSNHTHCIQSISYSLVSNVAIHAALTSTIPMVPSLKDTKSRCSVLLSQFKPTYQLTSSWLLYSHHS